MLWYSHDYSNHKLDAMCQLDMMMLNFSLRLGDFYPVDILFLCFHYIHMPFMLNYEKKCMLAEVAKKVSEGLDV
jgi:hypothetical protein